MTLDTEIKGLSGDLRIVRICRSETCHKEERIFERIGLTSDKTHWVYTCQRCSEYKYESANPKYRMGHESKIIPV